MSYNPGVTDISGQLRAQGIMQAGQNYGNALQQIGAGLQQAKLRQDQDQELLAKASSTEKFIKAHSDLFGGEETVKQLTAVDPRESPVAKYARLSQAVQDTIVGKKMEAEQQQTAQMKQAQAVQQYALQQQQLKDQQLAETRRRYDIYMSGGDPGAAAGQRPGTVGMATPPPAGIVAQPQLQQNAPGDVLAGIPGMPAQMQARAPQMQPPPGVPQGMPMQAPQGMPPRGMAMRPPADAMQIYAMTGQPPTESGAINLMGQNSREDIARVQQQRAIELATERAASREAIAAAQEETKRAKLTANDGPARYDTDKETGIRSVWSGAQWVPLPGQVAKDPYLHQIDQLEAAGDITHAAAVAAKKKLIAHRGTFSPNNGQAIAQQIGAAISGGGSPAAPATPAGDVNQFWEEAVGVPAATKPKFTKGQRVQQNGVVYEWDGTNMVPVK